MGDKRSLTSASHASQTCVHLVIIYFVFFSRRNDFVSVGIRNQHVDICISNHATTFNQKASNIIYIQITLSFCMYACMEVSMSDNTVQLTDPNRSK